MPFKSKSFLRRQRDPSPPKETAFSPSLTPSASAASLPRPFPNAISVLDYCQSLPSTPPSAFPRREWTSASFGNPEHSDDLPVSASEMEWGLKNASVAALEACETGDWSGIRDPTTTIALAICDYVLQLNDFWRVRLGWTTGPLTTVSAWENERLRDIDIAYETALNTLHPSLTEDVVPALVMKLALPALYLHYWPSEDSYGVWDRPERPFDRAWFGEHCPRREDLAKYGYTTMTGRLNLGDPNWYAKALKAAEEYEKQYPPPPDEELYRHNAMHYPPPR